MMNLRPYRLVFREPFKTAAGTLSHREGFVIEIRDDRKSNRNPCVGLGESAPLVGFGMESLAETEAKLRELQPLINAELEHIHSISDIQDLLTNCDRNPAAKHGVELALLNLLAQRQSISLAQLLVNHFGGTVRPSVAINAVLGAISPQLAAAKAQAYIHQGYRCLKIKVGTQDFAADFCRVKAVRSQVGNQIQIRIDANQGWTVETAIANLQKLADLDIEYVEQPVIASDLAGMARIKQSQSIPIAADEAVNNLAQLQQVINAQAADLVILKPMAFGGILTAHHAAAIAIKSGLDIVVTTTIEGEIARQAALDLAAALPIQRACGLATGHFLPQHCAE